jgi:allophanate hydrolase
MVCAHISGMPLNVQLRDLDARFAREAQTSDAYRLYALTRTCTS